MSTNAAIPLIKLKDATSIPQLGLGTWKSNAGELPNAVSHAISVGYRHIDTAFIYQNEAEIGEGLAAKLKDGTVKREEVYVVSKVWNTFHSRSKVMQCVKISLEKLQLSYLNLLHMHWPMGYKEDGDIFPKDGNGKFIYSDVDYTETWQGMEDCVKAGLVKSLGVSNFNIQQIQRILEKSEIKPSVVQVECHPYLGQNDVLKFCKENGLAFTSYSSFGSPDRPWAKPGEKTLFEEPVLIDIAKIHGKSAAQVMLRYQIQRGAVVIPKSVTPSRIEENMKVFDFALSEDDMKTIANLDKGLRLVHLDWVGDHPHYPFK